MHASQSPDDLEMAEFRRSDVHQKIFSLRVFAIKSLDRVLHGGGKLAVGSAELLKQHVAEFGIRRVDANREHQFLHVMVHWEVGRDEVRSLPRQVDNGKVLDE